MHVCAFKGLNQFVLVAVDGPATVAAASTRQKGVMFTTSCMDACLCINFPS